MSERKNIKYGDIRKKTAKLFYAVLTQKLCVRDALARFPKGCEDETIIASWHALCHLESDEDIRKRDRLYREEQDEYIEFIASTLQKGNPLPENIINEYKKYHNETLIPENNNLKGIIHQLKKFLCC